MMRWIILAFPVGLGLVLLVSGISGGLYQVALQRRGVSGKGTVVDRKTVTRPRGPHREVEVAVVEFPVAGGGTQRFETSVKVEQGQSVDVTYLLGHPAGAVIAGTEGGYSGPVFGILFGLLLAGGPILFALNTAAAMQMLGGGVKWIALALLGGAGVVVLTYGAVSAARRYVLLQNGANAEGTVVRLVDKTRGSGTLPVVEFDEPNGQKHTFVANAWGSYNVGDHSPVIFDRRNPSSAQLAGFTQFWLDSIVLVLFGAFFVAFGLVAFRLLKDVALEMPRLPGFISIPRRP